MRLDHKNFPWFDLTWAEELRGRTRQLTRIYLEACAAAWRMPHPYGTVRPGGLWGGRKLWIIGWLVRDAVIRHLQINLKQASLVDYLAAIVASPTSAERSLGIRKTASTEAISAAEERQMQREAKRQEVLSCLNDASADLKTVQDQVSSYKSVSNQIVGSIIGVAKNVAPLAVLAWIAKQFSLLAIKPLWQGVALCVLWIILYNSLGLLSVPFHDASYRKHLLFEGYMGKPEDGVSPLFPSVSRVEKEFYEHLGIQQPLVVSWDDLIPPFHYLVTVLIIVASLCVLPLNRQLLPYAVALGGGLAWLNWRRVLFWRASMQQRYGQSIPKLIAHALLLSISGQIRGSSESGHDPE